MPGLTLSWCVKLVVLFCLIDTTKIRYNLAAAKLFRTFFAFLVTFFLLSLKRQLFIRV